MWKCTFCNEENEEKFAACWNCQFVRVKDVQSTANDNLLIDQADARLVDDSTNAELRCFVDPQNNSHLDHGEIQKKAESLVTLIGQCLSAILPPILYIAATCWIWLGHDWSWKSEVNKAERARIMSQTPGIHNYRCYSCSSPATRAIKYYPDGDQTKSPREVYFCDIHEGPKDITLRLSQSSEPLNSRMPVEPSLPWFVFSWIAAIVGQFFLAIAYLAISVNMELISPKLAVVIVIAGPGLTALLNTLLM